jgi:uncharacterized protein YbjQ (UPF0145 family)
MTVGADRGFRDGRDEWDTTGEDRLMVWSKTAEDGMIMTTTSSVEGRRITAYRGIVTGEAILGANVFRDIFAGITDIIGGRSGAYEQSLAEARATALRELEELALAAGANAVVGVDLDYEVINNMLMVSASGTAVTIEG